MTDIRSLTCGSTRILLLVAALCIFVGCAAKKSTASDSLGRETPAVQATASSTVQDGGSLSILNVSVESAGSPSADAFSGALSGTRSDALSDDAFEDYADEPSEQIADPLEGWNRFWFRFNDTLLLDVIKPVYTGYAVVVPQGVRIGLSNVLYNLQMPIRLGNSILQGKFGQAWVELGRFIVNTTAGMGGVFDVAKQSKPRIPIDDRGADFGQTLATWGIGEGIYLVWPILGPSTARDTVGTASDIAASPFFWLAEPLGPAPFWPMLSADGTLRFNDMGKIINAYEAVTKGAIEPYIAAREAYVKYRRVGALRGRSQW